MLQHKKGSYLCFFFACCFQLSKEELAKLVQGFEKQEILTSSGVTLAGSRYIYLSGTDRVVRAKLGKVGVHCMKTTQGKSSSSSLLIAFLLAFDVTPLVGVKIGEIK